MHHKTDHALAPIDFHIRLLQPEKIIFLKGETVTKCLITKRDRGEFFK